MVSSIWTIVPAPDGATSRPACAIGHAGRVSRPDDPVPSGPIDPAGAAEVDGLLAALGPSDLWTMLFRDAPVAYSLVDLGGRERLVNQAFEELFDLDADDLTDRPVLDITHPDDRDQTRRYLARLAAGSVETIEVQKRYLRADGSTFWGLLRAKPLLGPDGSPVALLGSIVDISRQVEVTAALEASEHRLQALLSHTDAVVVADGEARLSYASPAAEAITGYAAAEMLGTSVLDFVHPDDREVVAGAFLDAVRDGSTQRPLQFRIAHADGRTVSVEVQATAMFDVPSVNGLVATVTDITDRADPDVASTLSERRFRTLLLGTSDTVTLLDAEGTVIDSLGTEMPTLGRTGDFWPGQSLTELIHPDDLPDALDNLTRVLANPGVEVAQELRALHADGTWQLIEGTAVNRLDDPDVQAIVLTSHNVTEARAVEAELAAARDEAVRTLEQKAQFVANVSHELRTPIHGILGLTELLATEEMDAEAHDMVDAITRAARTLVLVLDDILDFSKIEAGRLALVDGPVPLGEVVEDVVRLFEPRARSKGVALNLRSSPNLPEMVWGDGLRIRQIISNLVGNAVKFTDDGSITVSVECERRGLDAVDVRITVADTGIGISEEELSRLFEPFGQAHASTAQHYGGTGLGLSIARRLSEAMGGSLTVASRPGRGSSFGLALPRRSVFTDEVVAVDGSSGERAPSGPTPSGVVLVVEDNPVSQMLVARQLERLGYRVVITGSGEEALAVFPELSPAAVLMDWQLPGIDGLETTRGIRRAEELGLRVPVIAMTASALAGDRERCLEAGMDDVLTKPVSMGTLGTALTRWLTGEEDRVAHASGSDTAPAAASLGPDPTDFDRETFDRLADELGDAQLLGSVVGAYLRELPSRVRGIEDAVATGDRDELRRLAHTLKSTSAAMGASGLAAECGWIERECATGEAPVALPVNWAELHQGAEQMLVELLGRTT
jgi:PAS domain S-box-containing protein